ncbi:MAG: DUF4418 family protein [Deltaproteobacteria bacterium]|jgi:hypothetical protein|nr:DUF4418 family protein [Deltaproteobacteria bacterium]
MIQKYLPALICLVAGLAFIAIPHFIFPVCEFYQPAEYTDHSMGYDHSPAAAFNEEHIVAAESDHMVCYYTAKAELGLGLLVILGALSLFISTDRRFRSGVYLMLSGASVLGGLFPTVLIGVCPGPSMPCRSGTLPALILLSSFFLTFSIIISLAVNSKVNKNV